MLIGLAVCWGARDAYYLSLQQEQSKGEKTSRVYVRLYAQAQPLQCFLRLVHVHHPTGLSSSLAPPPLDDDLPVSERLAQVKTCLSQPLANRKRGAVVIHDIIQVYKVLVLSCGISLEGNCEDPKVRANISIHTYMSKDKYRNVDSQIPGLFQAVTWKSSLI